MTVPLAAPPGMAVFQMRDVTKIYRMGELEVRALRGVDLDLYPGEFVVVLGPSVGCEAFTTVRGVETEQP